MKRYTYQKSRKSQREKVGFFTAFSICVVAIGLALWSTYLSVSDIDEVKEKSYTAVYPKETKEVNYEMTGVTETKEEKTQPLTETQTETETIPNTEQTESYEPYTGDNEALQTILQVSPSLDYPVRSQKVTKQYSEEALYNETMGDYRPHSGTDFQAEVGENIIAMTDGVVERIYYDDMLGNVISVRNGTFCVMYCGVSEGMFVSQGETISAGNIIAKVGKIPCESYDESHIHIEVMVGDKNIDPLTVISSDR